jgi:hypothetical protein
MDKAQRAEFIAALVTDKYSGFRDGDEPVLEACADTRLEEFRAAADARKVEERRSTETATELVKANARLKVSEEKLRTAQEAPTEEDWLAKAPPRYKALIDADKAQEDSVRAAIVSHLKDLGNNTEAELKAMPTEQLKTLAAYARFDVPDFSGRGIAQERHASGNRQTYAAPDPYKDALAARRVAEGSKAVN